ncbi:MAG: hypothetical protein CK429_32010 [Mycobacterium sp.]|nr:MAG: hypothetical protein CK429_32010 [Mycobacterium sp.]
MVRVIYDDGHFMTPADSLRLAQLHSSLPAKVDKYIKEAAARELAKADAYETFATEKRALKAQYERMLAQDEIRVATERSKAKRKAVVVKTEHPTLAQVAERQKEIDAWEAGRSWSKRRARNIASGALGGTLLTIGAEAITGWGLLLLAAVLLAIVMAVFGGVWLFGQYPYPGPKELNIVPFTDEENQHWMEVSSPGTFVAVCPCPGCGNIEAHLIRAPEGEEQGEVVRRCGVCEREWAQA